MTRPPVRVALFAILVVAVTIAGYLPPAFAADRTETVNAFMPWHSEGEIHRTGAETGTFVGTVAGRLFVESEAAPLEVGHMTCPVKMEFNLTTGHQAGSGSCSVTAFDGAQLFTRWHCRGVHMVGCDGAMVISGGTGRFDGLAGGGTMIVRTTSQELFAVRDPNGMVSELGEGVLILRDFRYGAASD